MDRNPISDLQAVAAMPDLEVLAEVIAKHVRPGRGSAADPMSILILLAGRWAFGSANRADSSFRTTPLWEIIRMSARSVGRMLPERPPTYNQLRHLRLAADDGLHEALTSAFSKIAVPLAKEIGLLTPELNARWDAPSPSTVIYGDGSVVAPLSSVTHDDNGEVVGSRAKDHGDTPAKPRIGPHFKGKRGDETLSGLPITVVGCHGRKRWQRVVLGIDLFFDRNEIGSSMKLFHRVHDLAGGGVTHVVYDRLMAGTHMRELMKMHILPIVAMPEASRRTSHLVLPAKLQRHGYRSAGTREKRKGKGATVRKVDKVAPKARLALRFWEVVEHEVPSGTCAHELWSLDGAIVTVAPGEEVTLDAAYVPLDDLAWEQRDDGAHPIGNLLVPCRQGPFTASIDFATDREGRNASGNPFALADHIRPLHEALPNWGELEGLRSDVESTFSWLKQLLPSNRAGSLTAKDFFLDMIGAGLLCNAIAWDVHVSQHTGCAQHEAEKARRHALRS
jgi:hypothetical protein